MSQDALDRLEALLPKVERAKAGRKLGSSLADAVERLPKVVRQRQRLSALAEVVQELSGVDDGDLKDAAGAADELGRVMEQAATAAQLDSTERLFSDFATAVNLLENVVRSRWRDVVQSELLPLGALGRVLGQIPDLTDLAARLTTFGEDAQRALERKAAEVLAAEVSRLRSRRQDLGGELREMTGDEEVDAFLRKVTENGATLAMVTPTVLGWLSAHGALGTFAVTAARR